jgi:hypothetical protein
LKQKLQRFSCDANPVRGPVYGVPRVLFSALDFFAFGAFDGAFFAGLSFFLVRFVDDGLLVVTFFAIFEPP